MIVELGHFALILALLVAVFQMVVPAWGAQVRDARMMAVADPAALCQFGLIGLSFLALTHAYVTSDFTVANVVSNSHSTKPLLYRISGVWGNHEGSMVLWVMILALFGAAVAAFGRNLPLDAQGQRARRAVVDRRGLPAVHPADVESVPAHEPVARRRQRSQSDPAGPGARLSSAVSLHGLRRLLDRLLVRHRRADRRAHRRRLGALGAPVDARRLDVPDHRHRHGLVVGLLRARLGRLVVLGSGRERLVHAVARRHGAAALGARHGKARRAEGVDGAARHPHLLAVADGHVPRALRACSPRCTRSPSIRSAASSSSPS